MASLVIRKAVLRVADLVMAYIRKQGNDYTLFVISLLDVLCSVRCIQWTRFTSSDQGVDDQWKTYDLILFYRVLEICARCMFDIDAGVATEKE